MLISKPNCVVSMQVSLWVADTTAQCVVRLLCDLGFKFRRVFSLLCKVFCIRCVVEDEGYGMEDNSQLYGLAPSLTLSASSSFHILLYVSVTCSNLYTGLHDTTASLQRGDADVI